MSGRGLLDLANACEQATMPCVHVDREIAAAIGNPATLRIGHEALGNLQIIPVRAASYTASLDAAMKLVPEGSNWGAGVDRIMPGPTGWAWVSPDEGSFEIERAATPALALCAAALRARVTGDA